MSEEQQKQIVAQIKETIAMLNKHVAEAARLGITVEIDSLPVHQMGIVSFPVIKVKCCKPL